MKERATLFAERVVKSPASTRAWIGRLNSLGFEPNWTKQEMEQAGEGLLKADAARERGWTYAPMELIVAQAWVASGIRPKDCVDLADQALAEISLGPEIPNDLDAGLNAAQMAAQGLFGFNSELWNAMDVVLDASLQLRDLDKAYRMLAKMQQWLADNQVLRDNPTSGFARFRGNWLNSTGKVAEAEGQRLDALALYTKAIADGAVDPALAKHARSLWDEMGGTEERWKLVTARLPASKPPTTATGNASSSSPKTPAESVSGTRPEPAAWIEVNRPLPQMDLRDLTGQSWTVANFKGKTTLISLWATWCLPCRDELPSVQKLFDLTKGRADIQVITLNVDDDPGLVEPFMTENHFSFPVLLSAGHYVEAMDGLPIPQTWLVDQKANLREKSLGFNPKVTDWSSETLERLKHLGQ
jgi:thiol-disulfide isomerase/thioredoxin